jgi:hypothetical protein
VVFFGFIAAVNAQRRRPQPLEQSSETTEELNVPTPENDRPGRFGGAWERRPGDNRGVWLWVIYRADIHVLGAIRRATRLHWNADGAKEEVCGVVNRLRSSRGAETEAPNWDHADEATWVWRSKDYVCVAWSIRLPEGQTSDEECVTG